MPFGGAAPAQAGSGSSQEVAVRAIHRITVSAALIAVAACGSQPEPASLPDDAMSRDLALAAAEAVELAPSGSRLEVAPSEIQPPVRTAHRANNTPKPSPQPEPMPEPVSVEPAEIVAIAEEPELIDAPVGVPSEVDRPAPSRRPAPIPASVPVGGTDGIEDGGGIGTVIGTVIGVVIRGGAVGDDDCDLHRRPRPRPGVVGGVFGGTGHPVPIARRPVVRGGVAINNRLPTRGIGSFP
jgi:hypothetical protein